MYQLIVSDLDGTLLDKNHAVDSYTAETLQLLQQRNIPLVLATGRHFCDVAGIRSVLGIQAYLITSNGARVHAPDNQLIYRSDIDPTVVKSLTSPEFAGGCHVNLYLDQDWLIDAPNERLLDLHKDSGFSYQVSDLSQHDGRGVAKVLYIAKHEHLLELERKLKAQFGQQLTITFSLQNSLEVMAAHVSKGHALAIVLDRLGIDAADCVAFGDGQNDIELLSLVGHPHIMQNADPRLLDKLPDVIKIGSNHDTAVARQLRTLFELQG